MRRVDSFLLEDWVNSTADYPDALKEDLSSGAGGQQEVQYCNKIVHFGKLSEDKHQKPASQNAPTLSEVASEWQ